MVEVPWVLTTVLLPQMKVGDDAPSGGKTNLLPFPSVPQIPLTSKSGPMLFHRNESNRSEIEGFIDEREFYYHQRKQGNSVRGAN